ncbi:S-layer homology domain-containing protein [Fervidobacterium gondwanense]|uniref:S-layer homology domain-containing protein n=1 Tax=Fervidobacterium gondwanense DSM 13020 TaxID=1121883 RepID=A0A1M7RZS7_FERGO|nr:S-layer homology domain-containing protein [Fervidobacterium gondwanense]SHN51829.1 S-layer homology domain-containing protein [Fervidobacterium gondwanense DSM 13020]
MKKLLTLLTVLLLVTLSMAAFRDIPKGHWAGSYVQKLEEIGIVTGFPDGTYRGDESITRYQIAIFLVRTLDYVEQIISDKVNKLAADTDEKISTLANRIELLEEYTNMIYDTLQTKADVSSLDELQAMIEEFKAELEVTIQDMKLVLDLHDQDIVKLYDLVNSIQDKFTYEDEEGQKSEINLAELKNDVAAMNEILNGLAAQLGDVDYLLRKQIADLDKKVTSQDEVLQKSIDDINAKLEENTSAIEVLNAKAAELEETIANNYATLSDAILGQQEEFTMSKEEISARIDELETKVLNIQSTIDTGLPAIRDMVYGLSEDLKSLEDRLTSYVDVRVDDLATRIEALEELVANHDDRLNLVENQLVSLTQVVEEVKADKSEVEELRQEVSNKLATKEELEQTRQLATWGVVTGVSGLVIGIIALGKAFGWF